MKHIVPISGGKDSTCLAVALNEREPRDYIYTFTPTGDELPAVYEHLEQLAIVLGAPINFIYPAKTLHELIDQWTALPNARMRWCTRMLKIQPFREWLTLNRPATVYVGLRADEGERVGAVYDSLPDVEQRFPLREWGFSESDVWGFLGERGIVIPDRTDCARCYDQTLGEWWHLWSRFPDVYASAEKQEQSTGHTFRSATRDTWPANLEDLRKEFEAGKIPRGTVQQIDAFQGCARIKRTRCRVCSL